ncbi:MAG: alpha/beta hydrolase [Candidatus Zixiibacteriota bacterium]
MMKEKYHKFDDKLMFYRHNGIDPKRLSVLFVHGLGDSGLSFEDAFKDDRFGQFNLIVPDLIGYGRSSGAGNKDDYSYEAHVQRLWQLIDELGIKELILVGHSMGGDLTTLMCSSDKKNIIKKYVNIEGDLTQYDLTISRASVKAFEKGNFDKWFETDFKEKLVWGKLGEVRSGWIYYVGVSMCRRDAFLANALELVRRNTSLDGKYKSEIGRIFLSLQIPRLFCYGTKSLAMATLNFVNENNISSQSFDGVGHCPMTDASKEFYDCLYDFIRRG